MSKSSSACMRSISTTGTVAAPVTAKRSELRSYCLRAGWSSSVWKIVGGPGSTVMRCSATTRIACSGSKVSWGIRVAPVCRQARMPAL